MIRQEQLPNNEFAWKVHDVLSDWTARVDIKASISLAIEAAIGGFVVTFASGTGPLTHSTGWAAWTLDAGVAALALSIMLSILVVFPQLRGRKAKREYKDNFIYFGHLRYWDSTELKNRLSDDPVGLDQLARQLVNMSNIVWRKHVWLQWSMLLFLSGLLLIGFTLLRGPIASDFGNSQAASRPQVEYIAVLPGVINGGYLWL